VASSPAPGRYTAAFLAVLAIYRVDTPQKAFARLAPAIIAVVLLAVLFPTEFANHWGKAAAAVIAWLIVAPIVYVLALRTLPKTSGAVSIGLSPLYAAEGRRQFRAERAAIRQQVNQLESQSVRLDTDMANLDLTTAQGQEKFRQLSQTKTEIERELVRLKPLLRGGLGFTGHLDQTP
jgi:hypothetical protein